MIAKYIRAIIEKAMKAVDREMSAVEKMPDYKEHKAKIRKLIHRYGGHLTFEQAYKIAVHEKMKGKK